MAVDDANRGNNADIGALWAVMTGWTACNILTNEFTCTFTDASAERYTGETPADDQESSVYVGARTESQVDKGVGAICRASAAANTFYFILANTSASEIQYGKYVAGTLTMLGSYTGGATPATGLKIAIRAVGTRISARVSDVEVAFTTDSSIAAGQCGILSLSWNESQPSMDNWEGGGLVLAGPDVTHMWIPPLNHIRG